MNEAGFPPPPALCVLVNHRLNLAPVQSLGLPCCLHETLPESIDRRGFYPSGQIFYPLAFVVYCRPRFVAADPITGIYLKK